MLAARLTDEVLAARLGHELRNPLNGLCAALEVLEAQRPSDPVAVEALAVATRQARKLVQLVDEMLPRDGLSRQAS